MMIKNFFYKSYTFIAYFAIILVLFLINCSHIINVNIIGNIVGIIIGIMLLILCNKFIINKLKDKTTKIITIVGLIIFLMLTYLSVYYFRVQYNWDFKFIMESAHEIANTGSYGYMYYYKIFPNNWGALIIVTLSMKLFFGSEVGAYFINILFIFISAVFTILVAKKIGGNKLVLNALILLLGCAPLYLYAPIVYTDTLSVLFPVATLYFWLIAKENKDKSKKKYYTSLIMMTLMGVAGYCIKPVACIILVAIIINKIFTDMNKKTFKDLCIIILTFVILITGFNKVCEKFIIQDKRKNDIEYPLTHWIMMGLSNPNDDGGIEGRYGGYNQKDSDYTASSGNYEEKKKANIEKIKERLKNYGALGYIKFLANKFNFVWNDEGYDVLETIGWDTLDTESIPYKYIIGTKSHAFFRPYMRHFNKTLFVIMLVGIIMEVLKKEKNETVKVLGISIVGIALFLIIWEAESRYGYFLLPIFCLLGAYCINNVETLVDNILKKLKNLNKVRK